MTYLNRFFTPENGRMSISRRNCSAIFEKNLQIKKIYMHINKQINTCAQINKYTNIHE